MLVCFFRSNRPAADPLSSSNRLVNGMQAHTADCKDQIMKLRNFAWGARAFNDALCSANFRFPRDETE
jgi:hypothetical protein